MPITIWEPARYLQQFARDSAFDHPTNAATAAAPYNRDTKVCEIARFTGWKQLYFCDTGEFEVTTRQITPEQAQRGYMVDIDGDMFVIEEVEWELDEGGYTCTLSGRDFWAFPDRQINRRYLGDEYATSRNETFNGDALRDSVSFFFFYLAPGAGWFRDIARFPDYVPSTGTGSALVHDEIVLLDMHQRTEAAFLAEDKGVQYCSDIMSYGAEWRMFASWFNVGIRFDFAWNEEGGLYSLKPTIYDGQTRDIIINTQGRGVSGFRYTESSRNAVNQVYAQWEAKRFAYYGDTAATWYEGDSWNADNVIDWQQDTAVWESMKDKSITSLAFDRQSDSTKSYSERAIELSETFANLGTVPDANAGAASTFLAWAKEKTRGSFVEATKAFEFSYDNSGAYKYGEHFKLGDKITIQDNYLGVQSSQRLTGVKTTYSGGDVHPTYAFEFSNQRISQSDTLKRKFAQLDRCAYGSGRQS